MHIGDEQAMSPAAGLADRIVPDVPEKRERGVEEGSCRRRVIGCLGGSPWSRELCANGSQCVL